MPGCPQIGPILAGVYRWSMYQLGSSASGVACRRALHRLAATNRDHGRSASSVWTRGLVTGGAIDPVLPQGFASVADVRQQLWDLYPHDIQRSLELAGRLYSELRDLACQEMELVRRNGDPLPSLPQVRQHRVERRACDTVRHRFRPAMQVLEDYTSVASRVQRRDQLLALRAQARHWQAGRTGSQFPASFSLTYLDPELAEVSMVPNPSTVSPLVYQDPFFVPRSPAWLPHSTQSSPQSSTHSSVSVGPGRSPGGTDKGAGVTAPTDYLSFVREHPESEVLELEPPGPLDFNFSVCTLNVAGLQTDKLSQILDMMVSHQVPVVCLIDTQHTSKSVKHYGRLTREKLGPGACFCASTYNSTQPSSGPRNKRLRRQLRLLREDRVNGKQVGGQVFILNQSWGGRLVEFKDDHTGLGITTSVKLRLGTGFLYVNGVYWPVQGSVDGNMMRLEDKLQRWLHVQRSNVPPLQYIMDMLARNVIRQQQSPLDACLLVGDFNAEWGDAARSVRERSIVEWAQGAGFQNTAWMLARDRPVPLLTRVAADLLRGRWIDHIIHRPNQHLEWKAVAVVTGSVWADVSDHRPLICRYSLHHHTPDEEPGATALSHIEYVELPLRNKPVCKRFSEELTRWMTRTPTWTDGYEAGAFLHAISTQSVTVTRRVIHGIQKKRARQKDGWSPQFIALKTHLSALLEIRRHVLGQKGRTRWTSDTDAASDILRIANRWEASVMDLKLPISEKRKILSSTGRDPSFWRTLSGTTHLVRFIGEDIPRVTSMIHGRKRQEMRVQINQHVARREQFLATGQLGRVIKSVLDTGKGTFPMTHIRVEGRLVQEEAAVHNTITTFFADWFAVPPTAATPLHTSPCWHAALDSEEAFLMATAATLVPEELRKELYAALVLEAYPQASLAMQDAFRLPFTLEEFERTIKKLGTGKSAGPTGLTYNMMKKWPQEVVVAVHGALSVMWSEHHVPTWWKWRWLVPISKRKDGAIPTLTDLRPLCLLESLRKVWCQMLLGRVTRVWNRFGCIHESQHGSVFRRGTNTANLQHINAIEDAAEARTPLHRSSWDMSRAFDTLSRPVKLLSWVRTGVPLELAEYLVDLDGGVTVVRTPLASKTWLSHGYAGFATTMALPVYLLPGPCQTPGVASFIPERGVGQGDVFSPACWAAFLDMLARLLSRLGVTDGYMCTCADGNLLMVIETMYVDDMESKTATFAGMQRRADRISAFCLVFGIRFSESKIRRGAMFWEPPTPPPVTTLRSPGWLPIEIPTQLSGHTEYLGGLFDLDYSGDAIRDVLTSMARSHCQMVRACKASPETKLMVVTVSVMAKLLYKATISSLPLVDYEKVDKTFGQFYRSISKLQRTFPSRVLYHPRRLCGLGVPKFSDRVQREKLRVFVSALHSGGRPRDTALSLVARAARYSGVDVASSYSCRILPPPSSAPSCYWLRSVIERLAQAEVYLCRAGDDVPLQDLPVQSVLPGTDALGIGVLSLGDLVRDGPVVGTRTWAPAILPPAQFATLQGVLDAPSTPTKIRRGQFWRMSSNHLTGLYSKGELLEILGWRGPPWEINIQRWSPTGRRKVQRYCPVLPVYGSGTLCWISFADIFPVAVTPIRALVRRRSDHVRVAHVLYQSPPSFPRPATPYSEPDWCTPVRAFVAAHPGLRWRIYTDGSYTPPGISEDSLFAVRNPGCSASAGIVLWAEGDSFLLAPVCCIEIVDVQLLGVEHSYATEVLAAAVATLFGDLGPTLWTDCQSLVRARASAWTTVTRHEVLAPCFEALLRSPLTLVWTRGHPERYTTDQAAWSIHDWGNYMADKTAAGTARGAAHDALHVSISARTALQSLLIPGQWYIGNAALCPTLSIQQVFEYQSWIAYLRDRTAMSTRPPYYLDNTLPLAAQVYELAKGTIDYTAKKCRIVLDWGHYGRHLLKGLPAPLTLESETAAQCPFCPVLDSLRHWTSECSHPLMVTKRAEIFSALPSPPGDDMRSRIFRTLTTCLIDLALTSEAPERVWTSNFHTPFRSRLLDALADEFPGMGLPLRTTRSALRQVLKVFATGARQLWCTRAAAVNGHEAQSQSSYSTSSARGRRTADDSGQPDPDLWDFYPTPSDDVMEWTDTWTAVVDSPAAMTVSEAVRSMTGIPEPLLPAPLVPEVTVVPPPRRCRARRRSVATDAASFKPGSVRPPLSWRDALRTGNPMYADARVQLLWHDVMEVSVFPKPGCSFIRNDIVTLYAVKDKVWTSAERDALVLTLKSPEERTAYYHTQAYLYQVSKHRVYEGESDPLTAQIGVAQFMNSATPGSQERNNCKLTWFPDPEHPGCHIIAAQVTAATVAWPEQFLAYYGPHRKPVPGYHVPRTRPPEFDGRRYDPGVPLSEPIMLPVPEPVQVSPRTVYGYSDDGQWELELVPSGRRRLTRGLLAELQAMDSAAAVTRLLTGHEAGFALSVKAAANWFNLTIGDGACGFRAMWQLYKLSQLPLPSRATVPADVDLSDVAARTTFRDWLLHLLPPPLGPVVDLVSDSAHLSEVDILTTREKIHEFADWLSARPADAPVGNYTEGGGVLSRWFSTTCFPVLTRNFSPSALFQSVRVLPGGLIQFTLVGHNFRTAGCRLSGPQLDRLVSEPLPLALHGGHFFFLNLGNADPACSKLAECVMDVVRRLGAGQWDRDQAWQVDLRASNTRVVTPSPHLYINMVPARQRAHKAVAGLKKSVLTADAWRRLHVAAEERSLLLVPVPADSNSMASAVQVALLHSEVCSPETVPSPQELRTRVAGAMANRAFVGVLASNCEGAPGAVVCISDILAACRREWPDAGRYSSLYQYSCHVVSGDLDMLTLYGIAHVFGVAIVVIHDTDRPDWRIWTGSDLHKQTLTLGRRRSSGHTDLYVACLSTVTPEASLAAERARYPYLNLIPPVHCAPNALSWLRDSTLQGLGWDLIRDGASRRGLTVVNVPGDGNCFFYAFQLAMLDLGLWSAETLPTVAEIRLSVTTVMSQPNFPSLLVHDEANAHRDDTMDDIRMRHCEQMLVDRGSVPTYLDSWEAYCEYMRPTDDPEQRPWADILFALGASRTYGVTFHIFEPVRPDGWDVCLTDLTSIPLVVLGCNADHWVACLALNSAIGVVDGIGAMPLHLPSTPSLKRPTADPPPGPLPKKKKTPSLPTLPTSTGLPVKSTKAKALAKKAQQRYARKKKAGQKVVPLTVPSLLPPSPFHPAASTYQVRSSRSPALIAAQERYYRLQKTGVLRASAIGTPPVASKRNLSPAPPLSSRKVPRTQEDAAAGVSALSISSRSLSMTPVLTPFRPDFMSACNTPSSSHISISERSPTGPADSVDRSGVG